MAAVSGTQFQQHMEDDEDDVSVRKLSLYFGGLVYGAQIAYWITILGHSDAMPLSYEKHVHPPTMMTTGVDGS